MNRQSTTILKESDREFDECYRLKLFERSEVPDVMVVCSPSNKPIFFSSIPAGPFVSDQFEQALYSIVQADREAAQSS